MVKKNQKDLAKHLSKNFTAFEIAVLQSKSFVRAILYT